MVEPSPCYHIARSLLPRKSCKRVDADVVLRPKCPERPVQRNVQGRARRMDCVYLEKSISGRALEIHDVMYVDIVFAVLRMIWCHILTALINEIRGR